MATDIEGQASAPAPAAPPPTSILIEFGTSTGTLMNGRFPLRGARRVIDALNNWTDAAVPLTHAHAGDTPEAEVAVVLRQEIFWARPLEAEPPRGADDGRVEKVPREVVAHLGPYQLRGIAHTFADVQWVDFMMALSGQFFPLTRVHLTAPATGLSVQMPFVAMNASRLTSLFVLAPRETS